MALRAEEPAKEFPLNALKAQTCLLLPEIALLAAAGSFRRPTRPGRRRTGR